MAQAELPRDPLAAHELVLQRAQLELERRSEERRKPLPEHALAQVCFVQSQARLCIQAEVLDLSSGGMRLAAFADQPIAIGDRCTIEVQGQPAEQRRWATVRWVKPHPLIQCFGVQFDAQA